MLVGVCLSPCDRDFMGNLVVFPRSHHLMQEHFRRNGCVVRASVPKCPPPINSFDTAKQQGLSSFKLPFAEPVQARELCY